MFQISRDLSVESGPKVSEAGPGSVRALRPNSISDFQYRPVLDFRSVGPVLRSNPASTRPGPITADKLINALGIYIYDEPPSVAGSPLFVPDKLINTTSIS